MGIFSGLFGRGSEIDPDELEEEFEAVLTEQEQLERAYKIVRDLVVFTNKRLLLVDREGITSKKQSFMSVPYKHIVLFSKERSGHFEKDAELKIWVKGNPEPITLSFDKDKSIHEVYQVLGHFVL